MTKLLIICLGVVLSWPASETFTAADHLGAERTQSFFRFSTSAGTYAIRHDGMGEIYVGGRRKVFYLRMAWKKRMDRLYFLEHQGDLLMLCEVRDHGVFLLSMNQKTRNIRWQTRLDVAAPVEAPAIEGDFVIVAETIRVSKRDGRLLTG